MSETKTIYFQIAMSPTTLPGIDSWANGFSLRKQLSGDLTGSSEGLFINAGQAEGMRSYIVVEKLSGTTPEGKAASVILEHGGIEDDMDACFGRIVPGTGGGAWEGRRGSVKFDHDDAGEKMVLMLA